jgi:hypothetical protein
MRSRTLLWLMIAVALISLVQLADATRTIAASADANVSIAGFAFVNSSVTAQGRRADLPPGTKIYPPGSKITGTDGCPTTRYHNDGMIVAVIDYKGEAMPGRVAVTRHPASGGEFNNAPYYLDLQKGRILQFLGPIFENGSYDVSFEYDFALSQGKTVSTTFVLARSCPATP